MVSAFFLHNGLTVLGLGASDSAHKSVWRPRQGVKLKQYMMLSRCIWSHLYYHHDPLPVRSSMYAECYPEHRFNTTETGAAIFSSQPSEGCVTIHMYWQWNWISKRHCDPPKPPKYQNHNLNTDPCFIIITWDIFGKKTNSSQYSILSILLLKR